MSQAFRHNLVAALLVLALSLVSTHAFAQHYVKSVLVKNLAPAARSGSVMRAPASPRSTMARA